MGRAWPEDEAAVACSNTEGVVGISASKPDQGRGDGKVGDYFPAFHAIPTGLSGLIIASSSCECKSATRQSFFALSSRGLDWLFLDCQTAGTLVDAISLSNEHRHRFTTSKKGAVFRTNRDT